VREPAYEPVPTSIAATLRRSIIGVIGMDGARAYLTVIDYPNRRLLLLRYRDDAHVPLDDRDGFGCAVGDPTPGGYPVTAIARGSEAERAGDMNGDGFADVAITVSSRNPYLTPGSLFLHFGGPSGPGATPDRVVTGPPLRFALPSFGTVVAPVGDFDGDGYADLALGGGDSQVTLVFGGADGVRARNRRSR
jgi:hypothetical protein